MIEVNGLTRYYGDFAALRDVSFRVERGSIVGLLGRNGAGKSTTLKILAGLIPPSAGSVLIDGVDIVSQPERLRSSIGYLPEDPPLYTDMTVRDFVSHIGRLKGMTAAEVAGRIDDVLATAQLQGRESQLISTLSHGYRKRVGIAQAIIHDPKLVILDEPISGLDPVQIAEMRRVVRALAVERAVLLSSHILSEVEQTCDQLIVLADGRLVALGTEEEVTAASQRMRIRVEVSGTREALSAALDGLDGVQADTFHHVTSEVSAAQVIVDNDEARERIAKAVVEAGLGLRTLSGTRLEDAFLGATTTQGEG